jgi:uncharacterized protein (DUF1015 family)
MATLHPFRALRPVPEKAAEVACVPYDVISTDEARQLAEGKPLSFLHVIRPEIDLPPGTDEHDDAVYARGAASLRQWASSAYAVQEATPSLYVYQLVMQGRAQVGLFGCVAVSDYDDDTILKHEKTRPDKEDDRTRHLLEQRAHAEPVMLAFRDDTRVGALMAEAQAQPPLYDFVAPDGIQHTFWRVADQRALVQAFQAIPRLYVADGHHRCKAASRAAEALRPYAPGDEVAFFPAVLFPMSQMRIMPYNRVIRKLPMPAGTFLETLRSRFPVAPAASPEPPRKGTVCLYLDGVWHALTLPPTRRPSVADTLDVGVLGEYVLEPILGITDPRRDQNIAFVGGIRGTAALERLVDTSEAEAAFSMFPTSMEELLAVSDAGLLMPPKSTWFEPKLRSGLLVHLF